MRERKIKHMVRRQDKTISRQDNHKMRQTKTSQDKTRQDKANENNWIPKKREKRQGKMGIMRRNSSKSKEGEGKEEREREREGR
jgi:hypothetical protein